MGDWSPGSRVQGCLRVPDSDDEPQERVYRLQSASISIASCCPHNPSMGVTHGRGHLTDKSEQS